jgi:hypothetical protein
MKAYVTTTGVLFGLIVGAHIWRAVAEGPSVLSGPIFAVSTIASAALTIWAWRLRSGM